MLTLCFDSTAKVATVAVGDGEKLLAQSGVDAGLTQSELLLPMANHLLGDLHLTYKDVECYAVTVGPGSFTGVRIGVATVKGLAFGTGAKVVGVSTLRALAQNLAGLRGILVPVMDARRAQVYTAAFRTDEGKPIRLCEDRAVALSDLCAELKEKYADEPIYFVGDGYALAKKAALDAGLKTEDTPLLLRNQSAASLLSIAKDEIECGHTITDRELSPTYLRLPQAERERLEKMQSKA